MWTTPVHAVSCAKNDSITSSVAKKLCEIVHKLGIHLEHLPKDEPKAVLGARFRVFRHRGRRVRPLGVQWSFVVAGICTGTAGELPASATRAAVGHELPLLPLLGESLA